MRSTSAQFPITEAEAGTRQAVGPGVWLLLGIALVAFGVRVWNLGAQSLWIDEGISVLFSSKPPGNLLSAIIAEDLHPPAYYFALHYWMQLAGSNEYAVRFLSVASGFIAVPAIYQLTRGLLLASRTPRLGAVPVWGGGIAAGLAALSPFFVYYSQEARNYMMVTALTIVASVVLFKGQEASLDRARKQVQIRWWLAYVVLATLTLYTNYVGAALLLAHGIYLLLLSLRRRRFPLMGALSMAAIGLLYVPWIKPGLIQLLRVQSSPDFWAGSLSLQDLLERLFVTFSLGPKTEGAVPALLVFGLILVLGLVSLIRIRRTPLGRSELFLLLYLALPLGIVYVIAAQAPKFTERYVIMAAPAFYLLLARGVALLLVHGKSLVSNGRLAGRFLQAAFALGVLAVAVPSAYFTQQILTSPDYIRDNNRAAVAYIEAYSKPGDVIVLMMNAPHAFQYYYKGNLPWHGLHPGDNFQAGAADLNRITEGKDRLWLYLWNAEWADPAGFVRDSLDEAGPRALPDVHFPGVEVRLYSLATRPRFSADFKPRQPIGANFEGMVELLGYDPPPAPIPADEEGNVTLYWKALQPLKDEYVVSLRLKRDGFYWGSREVRPTTYFYPTTSWRPGVPIRGRVPLTPLPGTPPGEYQVEVAFHNLSAGLGRDLAVLGPRGAPTGTSVIAGSLRVAPAQNPPSLSDLALDSGDISLPSGNTIGLIGAQSVARSLRPGDTIPLTLFWKAPPLASAPHRVVVSIQDSQGNVVRLYDDHPVQGNYPTDRWQPGEVVRDQYQLTVPPAASAGPAALRVSLTAADGSGVDLATVARLEIQERSRLMARPEGIQHPADVALGSVARLAGFNLSSETVRPGETLRLVLYWQAVEQSRTGYTVFTHVLDSQEKVTAQQDNQPVQGTYPTTAWATGEYIPDQYELKIPATATPGNYVIETGMYDGSTGKRLDAIKGAQAAGDRIILGTVQIRP